MPDKYLTTTMPMTVRMRRSPFFFVLERAAPRDVLFFDPVLLQVEPDHYRVSNAEGDLVPPMIGFWQITDTYDAAARRNSSAVFAYTFDENIAIGLTDPIGMLILSC